MGMRRESSPSSVRHLLTPGFSSEEDDQQKGSARASVFLYSIFRLLIDPLREGLVLLMPSLHDQGVGAREAGGAWVWEPCNLSRRSSPG